MTPARPFPRPGRGWAWLSLVVLWTAVPALSHPLAPSLLRLEEVDAGRYEVGWKVPPGRGRAADLRPFLPQHCVRESSPTKVREQGEVVERWSVDCRPQGLQGHPIAAPNLEARQGEVLIFIHQADGTSQRGLLRPDQSAWTVPHRQTTAQVAASYAHLGLEHILAGFDHLLFVLGLVLLVPGWRRLLVTITGFTLGHSVTLGLATLGLLELPSAPVEAAIAASILWLAVELTRGQETLMHRRPWALASAFGLLHGLGFAGALAEVGLPAGEVPLALAAFNIGIEGGQILFVLGMLAIGLCLYPFRPWLPPWAPRIPTYFIGTLAAFWLFERVIGLF